MRKRRGMIQLAILHLLNEESMNGYQLMKELENRSDNHYSASSGTIYPALTELTIKEWIYLSDEEKKTYTITPQGKEKIDENLNKDFWVEWKQLIIWKKSEDAIAIKNAIDQLNDELKPLIKNGYTHPEKIKHLTQLIEEFTDRIRKEV